MDASFHKSSKKFVAILKREGLFDHRLGTQSLLDMHTVISFLSNICIPNGRVSTGAGQNAYLSSKKEIPVKPLGFFNIESSGVLWEISLIFAPFFQAFFKKLRLCSSNTSHGTIMSIVFCAFSINWVCILNRERSFSGYPEL